jgi:hypothetical protein
MRFTGAPVAAGAAATVAVGAVVDDGIGRAGDGGGKVDVETDDDVADEERTGAGEGEVKVEVVGVAGSVALWLTFSNSAFILSVLALVPGTMTDLGRAPPAVVGDSPALLLFTLIEYGRGAVPPTRVGDLARLPPPSAAGATSLGV